LPPETSISTYTEINSLHVEILVTSDSVIFTTITSKLTVLELSINKTIITGVQTFNNKGWMFIFHLQR